MIVFFTHETVQVEGAEHGWNLKPVTLFTENCYFQSKSLQGDRVTVTSHAV